MRWTEDRFKLDIYKLEFISKLVDAFPNEKVYELLFKSTHI